MFDIAGIFVGFSVWWIFI